MGIWYHRSIKLIFIAIISVMMFSCTNMDEPSLDTIFLTDAIHCTFSDELLYKINGTEGITFDDKMFVYVVEMWPGVYGKGYLGDDLIVSVKDYLVGFHVKKEDIEPITELLIKNGCSYLLYEGSSSYAESLKSMQRYNNEPALYGLLTERKARISELPNLYNLSNLKCVRVPKPQFDGGICTIDEIQLIADEAGW